MSIVDLLILLVVAGVCGALGRAAGGDGLRGGCLVSVGVGFLGALLGMWIARAFGLPEIFVLSVSGTAFPIVWSILGSALLVFVLTAVSRRTL